MKTGRQAQYASLMAAALLWACGGGEKTADQPPARDLSLAPAESTAKLNDRPETQTAAQPKMAAQPKKPAPKPATQPQTKAQPQRPAVAATPSLAEGTSIDLTATDTITTRHH